MGAGISANLGFHMHGFSRFDRAGAARGWAFFLLASGTPIAPAQAQANPGAQVLPPELSCPDELTLDLRPNPERRAGRVREIAPRAGAVQSPDLYAQGRLASTAYAMYGAFAAGEDPRLAFAEPNLRLVAVIMGDPGPEGEGAARRKDTRTLYGFVADEIGTGRRFIVFRGTQEPAEWVRNVQAGQRPYPIAAPRRQASAHVHAGFLKIFESLKLDGAKSLFTDDLAGLVAGREVVFVGHSLGSALATLAGVEASQRSPQSAARLRVVTLASPRVGDGGFARLAAKLDRIDRVCNLVDVVTAVPPSTRHVRYTHVGTVHKISSFDWPELANDLDSPGDQILCWHGDKSYTYMLSPSTERRPPGQCTVPAR